MFSERSETASVGLYGVFKDPYVNDLCKILRVLYGDGKERVKGDASSIGKHMRHIFRRIRFLSSF